MSPSIRHITLLALALVAAPVLTAGAQAAGGGGRAGEVRVRAARPANPELVREIEARHAERARLIARVRSLASQLEADKSLSPAARRQLQTELELTMEQLAASHARVGLDVGTKIVLQRAPGSATAGVKRVLGETERRLVSAARTGYLGITLSPTDNTVRVLDGGALFVRYGEHPSIISIEPGSPAERAGLRRGDVLLAYDEYDVRQEVPMHQLLEPGRPLRVRVQRDGREHTATLVVTEPPALVLGRREEFLVRTEPLTAAARGSRAAAVGGGRTMAPSRMEPGAVPRVVRFEVARGIAGAELSPITDGLGAALGVKRGLLVTAVAPRTPAEAAGLRDGDVILKANGNVVESIPALSRVIRANDAARTVLLEVRRDRKTRRLQLAW